MEAAGGPEREAYNGSQDYDLFLRLTEMARCIVHIPHALYYWRSSPGSTAADISAKTYCIDAGIAALRSHYQRLGVAVEDVSLIPETPGYYKTDYVIDRPGRGQHPDPHLRPCAGSGDLRGVHLCPHHLPGF